MGKKLPRRRKYNENRYQVQSKTLTREIRSGWFSEKDPLIPGQKFSLALEGFSSDKGVLLSKRSNFHDILVLQSAEHARVLCLDGVIQFTERDEFSFHEMLAHLPLFAHPHPRNVLIVGGGDGGVLREVCKHDMVEFITLVEIDPILIEVTKDFFADTMAVSFRDHRLNIIHQDAAEFLREHNQTFQKFQKIGQQQKERKYKYDVILIDSSKLFGPGQSLYTPSFYDEMNEALKDGGIICAQGECIWMQLDSIAHVFARCADIYDSVDYATTMVPTYPCGQMGFLLAGKRRSSCRVPKRVPSVDFQKRLRWYNTKVHLAAFVLPQFVERKLEPLRPPQYFEDEDEDDGNKEAYQENVDEGRDCFLGCTVS